jgi:hypothetical protein
MGLFSRKKEEVQLPSGGNELYTDRKYNTFWLLGLSPFEDYSDEEFNAAMDNEIKKLSRVLRTQPVEMVRVKTQKKLDKLQDIYGKKDILEKEKDDAVLMFNEDMLRYNNELSTDMEKIDSAIARSGWRGDGINPLNVKGLPQCKHCGYINRRVKKCIHCDKRL